MITVPDATPYPWPYDRAVEPGALALVLCGADGTASGRDEAIEASILELRRSAARIGAGVLVILHSLSTNRMADGTLAQPAGALSALPGETTVRAAGHDGFYGSSLDAVLRRSGTTHLLLAGMGLETFVHSTLRSANDRGYECLTVRDACTAVDERWRAAAISTIELSGGIFGAVGTTGAVLAALDTTTQEVTP